MTRTHHARRRFKARLVGVALCAILAGACGSDGGDEAAEETTSTTAAAPPAAAVTAMDYRFEGLPSNTAAGTRLTLKNTSTKEVHEIVAFRLPPGEQRSADQLVKLPQEQLMGLLGGPPAAVIVAPPGADGFPAVGNGTLAEPGRYLVTCNIPTGADPAAYMKAAQQSQGGPPQVPGGPPHFTKGMYGEIAVR